MFGSLIPSSWKSSPPASPPPEKAPAPVNPLNPEGIKPCCACPETKTARDECFMRHDGDSADEACKDLVQKHIECMRGYGFKI